MKSMPEFGTVRENAAAFDVAMAFLTSGDIAWGHAILTALRDHIWNTEEQKSTQWILPKVREMLVALTTCTPTPHTGTHQPGTALPTERHAAGWRMRTPADVVVRHDREGRGPCSNRPWR